MSENKYLRTIVKALDDKKGNDIQMCIRDRQTGVPWWLG